MMKKIIILGVISIIQIFYLQHFLMCKSLESDFYLTSSQVSLKLIGDIHDDRSGNLLAIRLIHNKLTVYGSAIFDSYLSYFSLLFLANSISLLGLVGMGMGFYYCVERKLMKILLPICTAVLIIPLIELFIIQKIPVVFGIFLLWFVFVLFSLFSWYVFLPKKMSKKHYIFCLIIIILSCIVYFTFAQTMGFYCTLPSNLH
jgi:hypothetical protein